MATVQHSNGSDMVVIRALIASLEIGQQYMILASGTLTPDPSVWLWQ